MNPDGPRRGFLLTYLKDYTANSNLHGLKYIGESSRSYLERIFWGIVFVLSICICGFLIKNLWTKWDQSPVIVSFGEQMSPVWQIPFPAITICSKNKAQESKFNYSKYYEDYHDGRLNESEMIRVEDVSLLCSDEASSARKYGNSSIVDHILSVAPPMDRVFDYCNWRGHTDNCDAFFSRVITNSGVCYSFNTLSESEVFRKNNIQHQYAYSEETKQSKGWTMEKGYSRNTTFDVYPRRGRNFGSGPDLIVQLGGYKSDINDLCDGPIGGHEVIIHNPAETVLNTQFHFEIKPGADITFAINVNLVSTSENLRNYAPTSRQCYFPTERHLKYFTIYTQKNCELECQSNFTFAMCGCVPFYLPHIDSGHICTSGSSHCVEVSNEILAEQLMTIESNAIETRNGKDTKIDTLKTIAKSCSCLPTCTIVSYDAVTTVAKYNNIINYAKALFKNDTNVTDELAKVTLSGLSFYFKESQYISMRRSELYGHTDFLANCGGLLGLFLGFSVLSLVEIFYFMTFRLCSVMRKSRISSDAVDKHKHRQE